MTVCTCPTTFDADKRIHRAYLDALCEVHSVRPPDPAKVIAELRAEIERLMAVIAAKENKNDER